MKAMIFAAGMGTRLKPLTDTMPKALVPVEGAPLLAHTIQHLCQVGVDEIVVNVHHFAPMIVDYLRQHDFPCEIKISDESEMLLETGGGLRKASALFGTDDSPILIHNVDIFSNANLQTFYERNRHESAALMVSSRKSSRQLLFNDQLELVGWTNLNTGEVRTPFNNLDIEKCHRYAFSGIHLFSPSLFPLMEDFPERFSIIDFYLKICDRVKIKADVREGLKMLDVGKQDTLREAEDFLEQLKVLGRV